MRKLCYDYNMKNGRSFTEGNSKALVTKQRLQLKGYYQTKSITSQSTSKYKSIHKL